MNFDSNKHLQLAYEFVENTDCNVFLTGNAGTGKTTFLHNIKKASSKRSVVVAPTGVAAINAGGVTIHSFFQLPFGPQIPSNIATDHQQSKNLSTGQKDFKKFNKTKINIIHSLDLLIIDEISMVRADVLDSIDEILRRYRNRHLPFGGIQLLMIGDLQQLTPVVKENEWNLIRRYYATPFFFDSHSLQQAEYVSIELKHIYRQKDQDFINLLSKVRQNSLDKNSLSKLNQRFIPGFSSRGENGCITLTTHNYQAQQINKDRLNSLNGKSHTFSANVEGDFPETIYPTQYELTIKENAQVMFNKNDPAQEKLFYNGKIGVVEHIDDDIIYVKCKSDDSAIAVKPLEWQNTRYTLDEETKEIKERVIGTFTQYPLKLAWAITIHKSQGLTFENAIIDAESAFAHGQVYVALSRCKTLEGLVLNSPLSEKLIKNDSTIKDFTNRINNKIPGKDELNDSKIKYQQKLLDELFDFTIIQKQLRSLVKQLKENKHTIDEELLKSFISTEIILETDIVNVGHKFSREIDQLVREHQVVENNEILQNRLKKACEYFLNKMTPVIECIMVKASIDSDNKQVKKSMSEALERLKLSIHIKSSCLENCKKGFVSKKYIEVRAKASIDKSKKSAKSSLKKAPVSENSNHPELLSLIRQWRDKKAEELNLPPYMVLPRKSMIAITNDLPGSLKTLLNTHGIGKKKVERFGEEILDMVNNYCHYRGVQPATDASLLSKNKPGKSNQKSSSKQTTFDLFKEGKSIHGIASERELAISTIESHLTHFISCGELSIEKLVSNEKIDLITEYFTSVDDYRLGPAKEILGEDVSFSELRWVLKHLELKGLVITGQSE